MPGSDRRKPPRNDEQEWLLLKDELTDEPKGYVNARGETRDADPETARRVAEAFSRELLVQDGEVVEELGMCFDGVCSVGPADPTHDALVLRNLGALSGLRPELPQRRSEDRKDDTGASR